MTASNQSMATPPADYPLRGTDRTALMAEALERAGEWLRQELSTPGSCFNHPPRKGFTRGIEFYSGYDLLHIMARSLAIYASKVGVWPILIDPRKQTEKLVWMKFFGYLPMPTPANKLTVGDSIPQEYRDRIHTAKVFWRSSQPALPAPDAIPKGKHFLKANNASGYNLHVQFPIQTGIVPQLKQRIAQMFQRPLLVSGGEWWYAMMQPEIFVEQAIDDPEKLSEWKFFVFNGKCHYLYEREGALGNSTIHTAYDRDFNHIPVSIRHLAIGEVRDHLPQFELMRDAAEAIARDMLFARVDFYVTGAGKVFLGEVTFCPANGAIYYSDPDFDQEIGDKWDHLAQYADERVQ
jgi:hypothetical protein